MLNDKQYEMLTLIADHCEWNGSELKRYWVPTYRDWSTTLRRSVIVSGSGDASCIKGLVRKGLVNSIPVVSAYGCVITESGAIALEEYRQANVYVNGKFPEPVEIDEEV